MSIQYAPIIADTIPGFTTQEIRIPFEDNPAVAKNQYEEYDVKVIDISNPDNFEIINCVSDNNEIVQIVSANKLINEEWFVAGKYYKIQICYRQDTETGPFSTTAIGRCCIPGQANISFDSLFTVKGRYQVDNNDKTEIPYYYQFIFYTDADCTKIFKETDKLLSVNNKSLENIYLLQEFPINFFKAIANGEEFGLYAKYRIITVNGLIVESESALNMKKVFKRSQYDLSASANDDKIILDLSSVTIKKDSNFVLARKEDDVYKTIISSNQNGLKIYGDYAVEHGKPYSYRIFYETDNSNEFQDSENLTPYFEHMVLSDSEKILRIKYDPKVSSFKYTTLEQKVDTLGGSYPIFFRNGNAKYAEIPISGLISYLADENEEFIASMDLGLDEMEHRKTTSLEAYNFAAERRFKLAVLEWLNNGKPKLFRSPAEGNYIVRLMNVSLSPMDQIGRMLHSFSATGYEIANYSAEELNKANLQLREVE